MKLSSLKEFFQINPEERITSFAAILCASLLVGLAGRILWVAFEGPTDAPAPIVSQEP